MALGGGREIGRVRGSGGQRHLDPPARERRRSARATADLAEGQRKAGNWPRRRTFIRESGRGGAGGVGRRIAPESELTAWRGGGAGASDARADGLGLVDGGGFGAAAGRPIRTPPFRWRRSRDRARRPAREAPRWRRRGRAARERARAWSASSAGAFRLGAAGERQPDGKRLAGPAFELDLPAFNAARPRLEAADARADEAAARAEEEAAELTAELEILRARLVAARKAARRWRDAIVPARAGIAAETQLRYNGMLTGAAQLRRAPGRNGRARRADRGAARLLDDARGARAGGGRVAAVVRRRENEQADDRGGRAGARRRKSLGARRAYEHAAKPAWARRRRSRASSWTWRAT